MDSKKTIEDIRKIAYDSIYWSLQEILKDYDEVISISYYIDTEYYNDEGYEFSVSGYDGKIVYLQDGKEITLKNYEFDGDKKSRIGECVYKFTKFIEAIPEIIHRVLIEKVDGEIVFYNVINLPD